MKRPPLVRIQETPLSVDEVLTAVSEQVNGGVAVFLGLVRDHDHDQAVTALTYSSHPGADTALGAVVDSVAADHPDAKLAAVHRVGDLQIGDIAVIVAAGCVHRDEAFDAARELIDKLKATVPIWKHQTFVDGTDEWVGLP